MYGLKIHSLFIGQVYGAVIPWEKAFGIPARYSKGDKSEQGKVK